MLVIGLAINIYIKFSDPTEGGSNPLIYMIQHSVYQLQLGGCSSALVYKLQPKGAPTPCAPTATKHTLQ